MNNISIYKNHHEMPSAKIRRLKGKRDWMDSPTYNCYPISFANTMGYGVYYEKDISFIWDGNRRNPATAILGEEHVWSGRGDGTVSLLTNFAIKTEENLSILTMPVPNLFPTQDATCITTLLSTSFLSIDFPIVWKIHTPNKEILIPAGTDVACLLPISVGQLQNTNIDLYDSLWPYKGVHTDPEYVQKIKEGLAAGEHPRMYKQGIDHKGNIIGKHEVDNLKMTITEKGRKE